MDEPSYYPRLNPLLPKGDNPLLLQPSEQRRYSNISNFYRCDTVSHVGPNARQKAESGSNAEIGCRLRKGSEALYTGRQNATNHLSIPNSTLYVQYQLEKKNMEKQYAGKNLKRSIELHLYHGTDQGLSYRRYEPKDSIKFTAGRML